MNSNKILVTYASQAGSTAEIAHAIGQTLTAQGVQVDVRPIKDVTDLNPYCAVVAGSAIHGSKWLPEAVKFLKVHQGTLARKPFAAFLVCITLGMANGEKYRSGVADWMNPVRALVTPVSEGLFAGELDFKKLPLTLNTSMMRAAVAFGALPQGDHRDWNAIRTWAESIYPFLG